MSNQDRIFSKKLVEELINYAVINKAERVYLKAINMGKYELAARIKSKYMISKHDDDLITSFKFALVNRHKYE